MTTTSRPRSLHEGVSVQTIGVETLVYDERRHQAFCLNRIAATVWSLCDGGRTVPQIAEAATLKIETPVSSELVELTLAELRKDGLLEAEAVQIPAAMLTRRSMMAKAGASAVIMLPVIAVVMAPKAAQAYSGCVNCTPASAPASAPADAPSNSSGGLGSSPNLFK